MKLLQSAPIYSPDDGGWYVEIYNQSGRTVEYTTVCRTATRARREAEEIIRRIEDNA